MTETPTLFAATPDRVIRSVGTPDVLSEMLRSVRLTGSVFFGGSFTAPFAVISPKHWDEGTPLAHMRHQPFPSVRGRRLHLRARERRARRGQSRRRAARAVRGPAQDLERRNRRDRL